MTLARPCLLACIAIALVCNLSHAADVPNAKLVITKAVYGDIPNGASTDVTKKVADMVKDNILIVDATNDNFGDPCEGTGKKLRVEFTADGKADSRTVDENQTLTLTATMPPAPKLVITKAVYGDIPNGASTDVTKKVAEMVKDNALSVEATNDNFGDPAEGVGKKLKLEYTLDGKADSKTVEEGQTLTITPVAPATGGKLEIIKAWYGDLPNGTSTDVTKTVAGLVKNNSLTVDASNDNFGDPAEGVGKKLRVVYAIGGVPDTKTVNEGETLTIADSAARSGKLVITKAVYGDIPNGSSTDVTAKVAAMIKDDALSVGATNDNFGDPAEGVGKKLKVDYTFNGAAKTKTVDENETLNISSKGE